MKTSFSRFWCFGLLVPALALGGCRLVAQQAIQQISSKAQISSSNNAPDTAYISTLKPTNSGSGLVIFEPVAAKSVASLRPFGVGAARYLQVHVGGQGKLGKTPMWGTPENLRQRFKLPNLQLEAAQARELAKLSGATHFGIGHLSGTANKANLNYEIRALNSNKVVGREQISGSPVQLSAQLPQLALRLAKRLGVSKPVVPKTNALSAQDVAFLGKFRHKMGFRQALSTADATRLKNLALKEATAAILLARWANFGEEKAYLPTRDALLKKAPQNAYAWGEAGYLAPKALKTVLPQLLTLKKRFPHNSLLIQALTQQQKAEGKWPQAIATAQNMVKAAPQSSLMWTWLAEAYGDYAGDIRKGRYSANISAAEWQQINPLYAKAHAAAIKATKVDPGDSFAWSRLAHAATFNDDRDQALEALEKAIELDPGNGEAWNWGLQIMQDKWGGSEEEFVAFAERAAQNSGLFEIRVRVIMTEFLDYNRRADTKPILETVVKNDPQNVAELSELGQFYHYDEANYPAAEKMYRRALALNPDDGRTNSALGDLTYWVKRDPKTAESLYRKAIQLEPKNAYFHGNLGRMLALTGRKSEGQAMAQKAKQLGLDSEHPVWEATGVSP